MIHIRSAILLLLLVVVASAREELPSSSTSLTQTQRRLNSKSDKDVMPKKKAENGDKKDKKLTKDASKAGKGKKDSTSSGKKGGEKSTSKGKGGKKDGDDVDEMEEKTIYKIYLSGPEVFLADPVTAGEEAKASCEEANDPDADFYLEAVFPLDNVIEDFAHDPDTGLRIFYANVELMDDAFATASNMIRFRSPSMDVGTAFEMGYITAQGKPVFGYYDAVPFYGEFEEPGEMRERVHDYGFTEDPTDRFDKNDHEVENFQLTDNLMMTGAMIASGYYPPRKTVYESCLDAVEYIKNNM